jgi:hypothetical protein
MNGIFKVVCIAKDDANLLTIGKVYDAKLHTDESFFSVLNDREYWASYWSSKFITLAEWRNQQIDKILEDDV